MNKQIVVVNGFPSSGKTTFEHLVGEFLPVKIYSSVDPIRELLPKPDEKTPEYRQMLSLAKRVYRNYIRERLKTEVETFYRHTVHSLMFIDCREPEEIDWIKNEFKAITLLVKGRDESSNVSDSDSVVMNYTDYEYVVNNMNGMPELVFEAERFVNFLMEIRRENLFR